MLIAISSCLLGTPIRYDKTGQKDAFLSEKLGKYVQFLPFCPEHLAFGTPRETIRIVLEEDVRKVYTVFSKTDVTQAMNDAMQHELQKLLEHPLCGIVLKSKSPSCALGSTKYYTKEMGEGKKDGLFALTCKEHFPLLPIEEEARLLDPWLRENFIMHVFAYEDMMTQKKTMKKMAELVAFHTSYKFLLQTKSEKNYRELGRIVANHEKLLFDEVLHVYTLLFLQTIALKHKISRTVNVLEHMMGFFKELLRPSEKKEIHLQIEAYKDEIIPLVGVMNTIEFLAKKYEITYLLAQKFLNPYPKDLALRSHIHVGK